MKAFIGILVAIPLMVGAVVNSNSENVGDVLRDALFVDETERGCGNNPADIVFVLDESGSIWGPHFTLQLDFVNDVIDVFDVGPDTVHIGVETFGTNVTTVFQLGEYNSNPEVLKARVSSIVQARGGTRTFDALERMRTVMFSPHVTRRYIPHIAIVITDGESESSQQTADEAVLARQQGITVFAIGVGHSINQAELVTIASSPAYVFTVESYDALNMLRDILAWTACQVTTLAPTTTTTTEPTTTPPQMIQGCSGHQPVDVVFALSDQAGRADTDFSVSFVKDVISDFQVGPYQVQAGLTPRLCHPGHGILLKHHDTQPGLQGALDRRQLTGARTDLHLQYLIDEAFLRENGGRDDSAKFGVLIVDNSPLNMQETLRLANEAKDDMDLIVIGVGGFVQDAELEAMASTSQDWYKIRSYEQLGDLQDEIIDTICRKANRPVTPAPIIITTNPPVMIGCETSYPMDVLFSIPDQAGRGDTQNALYFVSQVVERFHISPIQVLAGMSPRLCEASAGVTLRSHDTQEGLQVALDRRQLFAGTRTDLHLTYMKHEGFDVSNGARLDAVKFGILIIDNHSTDIQETIRKANELKENTIVIAIGVGTYVTDGELQSVSSGSSYWFRVDASHRLPSIQAQIVEILCATLRNIEARRK